MCGRFTLYTQPAKVVRFKVVTPPGAQRLNPGLENLDESQILLKPAEKGMLEHRPVSNDVGKIADNGNYLLAFNSE